MEQYTVTGMSCAACSSRVEKAVSKVPGVTSCSVSLLTNSMGVEGTASAEAIISAVEEAGYVKGPGNAGFEAETFHIPWLSYCSHVFFHGAYDVGMAGPGIF